MPSVAVIGASNDRRKYGNKAVRAYSARGWTVYPVNPSAALIEGLKAWARPADIPGPVDRAALYVPPEVGEGLLDDLAVLRPREVYLNPGTESTAILAGLSVRGLAFVVGCAILAIGERPADYAP